MKLQYVKIISNVAHVQIMMVYITKNMLKQVKGITKLGRFGTGVPLAPVWQTCGKPSTKFPHGGLVECLFIDFINFMSFAVLLSKLHIFEK